MASRDLSGVISWHDSLLGIAGEANAVTPSASEAWVLTEGSAADPAVTVEGFVGLRTSTTGTGQVYDTLQEAAVWHDMSVAAGSWVDGLCVDEGTLIVGTPRRVERERAGVLGLAVPSPGPSPSRTPCAELARLRHALQGDEEVVLVRHGAVIGFRVPPPGTPPSRLE